MSQKQLEIRGQLTEEQAKEAVKIAIENKAVIVVNEDIDERESSLAHLKSALCEYPESERVLIIDKEHIVAIMDDKMHDKVSIPVSDLNVSSVGHSMLNFKYRSYGTFHSHLHLTKRQISDAARTIPVRNSKSNPKIGRNTHCTCGSGNKFKNCCGR